MARLRSIAALLACAAAPALAACGGPPRAGEPRPDEAACDVVPASTAALPAPPGGAEPAGEEGPVVVGMTGAVDPSNAPVAHTAAERLVFAQLYETLVRVGCDGRIEPGLAEAWRTRADGRIWTFTLREDARDWTGAPVTARDVAESWLTTRRPRIWPRLETPGEEWASPAPWIASVSVLDARTVRVEAKWPVPLHAFARPELGVRTAATVGAWPAGTGRLRPEHAAGTDTVARGTRQRPVRRLVLRPAAGGAAVEFRAVGDDARNALDAGVDLLVTRDPAAAEYAAGSGAFLALPLSWDRVYVVLTPAAGARDVAARAPEVGGRRGGPRFVLPPRPALEALARDAVRTDARPAAPLVESGDGSCVDVRPPVALLDSMRAQGASGARGAPPAGEPGRAASVVYPAGDAVARSLAERLVALAPAAGRAGAADAQWLAEAAPALARAGEEARAAGAGDAEFAATLRAGDAAAYVVPLERVEGASACEVLGLLYARAPWLGSRGAPGAAAAPDSAAAAPDDAAATSPPEEAVIAPLVESRPVLVVRRGILGVAVDGRGTLRLGRVRRAGGGER